MVGATRPTEGLCMASGAHNTTQFTTGEGPDPGHCPASFKVSALIIWQLIGGCQARLARQAPYSLEREALWSLGYR